MSMKRTRGPAVEAVTERVTASTLELFFDLVFVFALTQVTAMMASDLTTGGLARGMFVLAIIWWCWVGYSWLANIAKADEGATRLAILVAMAAMFVLGLAVPESFTDMPGGLHGPTVFALAYLVLRGVHVLQFVVASKGQPLLRRQIFLFATTMTGSTALLIAAGQTDGSIQMLLWGVVVVIDYGGTLLIGNRGWRIHSAKHFAERHGLIVIVALGESIVAIGLGAAELPVSWPILVAAVLGLSVSASLWWTYFDTGALRAEHALSQATGEGRAALGQIAYTYLHLPLVAGVVLIALGLKKVLAYAGDPEHHDLSEPLTGLPLAALLSGAAMYLVAHAAFGRRAYGEFSRLRAAVGISLLVLYPVASQLPAIVSLSLVALLLAGLNAAETIGDADRRREVRHRPHEPV